jgi:hypothetical protein
MHWPHPSCAIPWLILATPLAGQNPEKHVLRLAFTPGSSLRQVMTSEVDTTGFVGGRKLATSMRTTMHVEIKVGEVKDGIAELVRKVTRIQIQSSDESLTIDYDSEDEDSDPGPMRKVVELLGEESRSRMDALGRVLEAETPEELETRMPFGKGGLSKLMEPGSTMLPAQPVAIGDTWQDDTGVPLEQLGAMRTKTTSKLTKIESDKAYVDQRIEFDMNSDTAPLGMKLTTEESTGQLILDMKAGEIVELSSTLKLRSSAGEGSPVPLQMWTTMRSSLRRASVPDEKVNDPGKRPARR